MPSFSFIRRPGFAVLLLAIVAFAALPRVPVDRDYLLPHTLERDLFPRILEQALGHGAGADSELILTLTGPGSEALRPELNAYLRGALDEAPPGVGRPLRVSLRWDIDGRRIEMHGALRSLELETFFEDDYRLLGWDSLLPPLIAILLAFAFRRTLLCLGAGIWVGATLLMHGNPLKGLAWAAYDGVLRHALVDQFRIEILLFIFALVGAVGVMSRMGGISGLLKLVEGAVRGTRSAQFLTSLMGLLIFFDDYANTILVGTTMRPLTDRWKISRERLAYIVDSTAAPVAGLSVLSTWVAYEMSLYADQLPLIGIEQDAYIIFLRTIPYRFYSIFTLALVLMGALGGRSFGPMLRAERRARGGAVSPLISRATGTTEKLTDRALARTRHKEGLPARWWNAALPLTLIILATIILMIHFGNVEGRSPAGLLDMDYLRSVVLSNTNSTRALALAALGGFVLALIMARGQRLLSWREGLAAGAGNWTAMFEAVGILILAWVMGHVCTEIGTSHVLIAMANGGLDRMALLLPLILFLTGAAVSFATGSSWSTMAILLPNVVLLAGTLGESTVLGSEGMLLLAIGAVLEGSIFGDHCSPISDTTILSSVASACPHMAHVKTQAPLALVALSAAVLAGYLPVALGAPVWMSLLGGIALLYIFLRLVGRRPEF